MATTTRLLVLSSLFIALPACDAKSEGEPIDGDTSTGDENDGKGGTSAESEGEVDGESESESESEGEVDHENEGEDFGRAGEACDQSELSAACQSGGVEGREFCVFTLEQLSHLWTECLTETCTKEGESRACEGGEQHCALYAAGPDSEELRWGECGEPDECEPGEQEECPSGGEAEGLHMNCISDAHGRHVWNWEACNTPLVLSFGDTIEFAATSASAADFDIHGGSGGCTRADWPTPSTPWLALDRDGNGSIDGGQELFGSATRMSAGTGPHNGFQALAELDSDRDGKITAGDARWSELVLWADHDADRRSSGWEMLPLASFEIVEIDLGYTSRRECDARGNCGLERASFVYRTAGRQRTGEVVDVRVTCE